MKTHKGEAPWATPTGASRRRRDAGRAVFYGISTWKSNSPARAPAPTFPPEVDPVDELRDAPRTTRRTDIDPGIRRRAVRTPRLHARSEPGAMPPEQAHLARWGGSSRGARTHGVVRTQVGRHHGRNGCRMPFGSQDEGHGGLGARRAGTQGIGERSVAVMIDADAPAPKRGAARRRGRDTARILVRASSRRPRYQVFLPVFTDTAVYRCSTSLAPHAGQTMVCSPRWAIERMVVKSLPQAMQWNSYVGISLPPFHNGPPMRVDTLESLHG